MTPEGLVKSQVDSFLQGLGDACWYFKPMSFGYGRKGIPDFVGIYYGWGWVIETKRKGGILSPWQIREMRAIHNARGIAMEDVINVEQIKGHFQWMRLNARELPL